MCHRTCSPRDQTLCFFRDAEACRDANITLLAMYFTCDISLMYYSDSSSDFAQRDRTLHPRDPRTLTPQHENDAAMGNFFMLWGEPLLGAKKEREKEEESSCLVSLHQYSIIRMQSIFTILLIGCYLI